MRPQCQADTRVRPYKKISLVYKFILKGYLFDRALEAGIGDTVFFKLHNDFFGQRRTDFGHNIKNSVRSYPIILLGNKFLFKGELSNLLEEIFHISRGKLDVIFMIRSRSTSPVLSLER